MNATKEAAALVGKRFREKGQARHAARQIMGVAQVEFESKDGGLMSVEEMMVVMNPKAGAVLIHRESTTWKEGEVLG